MSDSADAPEPQFSAPVEATEPRRRGFLPIETNAFDRVFIGVVLFVAIHLLWMRFLEPAGLSLYFATAISVTLGALIVARG
jgi:predicted small integral membrane protein